MSEQLEEQPAVG